MGNSADQKKKGMQLTFQLPEIDKKETQKRVEDALETARIYKQIGFVRREIKNTPNYEPRLHGGTNAISKPAEDVGIWNVDMEDQIREQAEKVEWAVGRLWRKEREIIQRRYLEEENAHDFLLCNEMHMSERTYRRIKADAFYKLGIMLKLAVYIWPDPPEPESPDEEKNVAVS